MRKMLGLALMTATLTGCSYFQIHKLDVEQGNILTPHNVSEIHRGMTKGQVEEILGSPMLVNLFSPQRVQYIYTMQHGHEARQTERVSLLFVNGRVQEIVKG